MASMKNVSKIMPVINNQIKLPELQEIMRKFDEEQMKNQLKEEMIDDMMDDALDHDIDAEDELIAKVLDEIGIEIDGDLDNVPINQLKKPQINIDDDEDMNEDLQ